MPSNYPIRRLAGSKGKIRRAAAPTAVALALLLASPHGPRAGLPMAAPSLFSHAAGRSTEEFGFRTAELRQEPPIVADFVTDHLMPGSLIGVYPTASSIPEPTMTDRNAFEGRFSLEVKLDPDAFSGCVLCSPTPLDLSPEYKNGMLEFMIKGSAGGEVFNIGLTDQGQNGARRPLQAWVGSRSYGTVRADGWTAFRIPLSDFGTRGSYWNQTLASRLSEAFQWEGVRCLSFEIDRGRQKTFAVWVDNLRFMRSSSPAKESGTGYPFSNETSEIPIEPTHPRPM